ncbi:MAG TPA: PEGA domain-containing protein, partial [Bdellovibrionota bacterium]|nr:PEGA domain-containing protein [Bdellovibrionota bacterium]
KQEEIKEMGAIAITTDPPFADLTVQGFKVGQSPLTLEHLPKGIYSIEARLSGYISATDSVEIHDKSQRIVSLSLQRPKQSRDAQTGLPYLRDNEVLAKLPPKKVSKDHWWEKPWVWGSTLLVGGGVLVFFLARDSKDGGISINLP